jgi:hypothetical protein
LLDEDDVFWGDEEVVAMTAKQELPPFMWRAFAEGRVALSEEGAVATQITEEGEELDPLTTTGVELELTEGKYYWEVDLLSGSRGGIADIACYLF